MSLPFRATHKPGANALRLLTGAGVGIIMGLYGTTDAYAVNGQVAGHLEHFFKCKMLLLTDPAQHAAECLPNNVPPFFGTLAPGGAGGVPPVAKPDDPAPDEEDEPECDEFDECCSEESLGCRD